MEIRQSNLETFNIFLILGYLVIPFIDFGIPFIDFGLHVCDDSGNPLLHGFSYFLQKE